jgi:hypothetical protein
LTLIGHPAHEPGKKARIQARQPNPITQFWPGIAT